MPTNRDDEALSLYSMCKDEEYKGNAHMVYSYSVFNVQKVRLAKPMMNIRDKCLGTLWREA